MNEREKNKELRYKEILVAGLDLIVEKGYSAFRIRDLAARLDISVGLFFHYFKSKEDLYKKLVEIGISTPMELVESSVKNMDPLDVFTKMADRIFDAISRDSFTSKMFVMMYHTTHNRNTPKSILKLFENFDIVSLLIPVVKKGQEIGTIKQGKPETLILTYWSAINGIAEFYQGNGCITLPKGEWISDILRN